MISYKLSSSIQLSIPSIRSPILSMYGLRGKHAPVRRDDDMDSYGRTYEANVTAITMQMQQDAIASLATLRQRTLMRPVTASMATSHRRLNRVR